MARATKQDPVVLEFSFGDRVRKARLHVGLGQKELAEQLGMYPSAIAFMERGGRPRGDQWEVAQKIGEATGVDAFWLLTGESRIRSCFCNQDPCVCDLAFLPYGTTDSQLPSAS